MAKMPSNKTKVLHLITLLEFGGAQGNTIYTVQNLDESKYETHLWAGKGAFWDNEVTSDLGKTGRLKFLSFLVRPLNPIFDFLAIFEIFFALKKLKPTIVHTHSSKAGILGRMAAKMAGVPKIIHTFHGFGFNDEQKPWTRFVFIKLEKLTAPMADKLIFVSKSNIATAKKLKIGKDSQYCLIRSGIPVKKIQDAANFTQHQKFKESLKIPVDEKIISTIGAFKPQKNLKDFLKMASSVLKNGKKVHFLIIGDGKQRSDLESEIERLGIGEQVHLLGWRKDVPNLLSITDLFVMTSLWEGLPRALVEAIILGVPAICYDTDGVNDLLQDIPEAISPQKDLEAFTTKVEAYLSDNSSLSSKIDHISDKIAREFDIDLMVRQQEDLYAQIQAEK